MICNDNMKAKSIAIAATALLCSCAGSFAATITWGASGQPDGDFDVFSNGDPITTPDFTYELGVFQEPGTGDPFSPTVQNLVVWEENWVSVASSMLDPVTGAYGGTIESDVFNGIPAGSRVYIWGYDSQNLTESPEWVLFTGTTPSTTAPGAPTSTDWLSPDGSLSQANLSLDFEAATADTAVVGRIPGIGTDPEDFGGEISNPVPLGTNTVQTATVPEPSSAGLLFIAGLCGILSRRRQRG